MTRLPALNAKTLEKILFNWDLSVLGRKEAMHSTDTLMEGLPQCHITPAEISLARSCVRY